MLKLADLKDKTDQEVIDHIISSYADDGYDGYGRKGEVVTEGSLRDLLTKYEILVAYESVGSWGCDSSSFFILKNKETESYAWVSGGHCSCYGFEGQFKPEDMPTEWFLRDDFYLSCGGYDDDEADNKRQVMEWIAKHIGQKFDPADKEMWKSVLSMLNDDEDGAGYLFDHFKTLKPKIEEYLK